MQNLSRAALIALVFAFHSSQSPATEPDANEWFEREVRPLLAEHCYSCHSSTVAQPKGGLTLDSREGILKGGDSGPAAVAGNVNESLIAKAIRRQSMEMPPDKPLARRDQLTIERWIAMGMPWPETPSSKQGDQTNWVTARAATHWAWQPVRSPSPPALENDSWSRGPIDRFIAAEMRANEVVPSPPADGLTLLRRLSFDLTGLPPVAREVTEVGGASISEAQYLSAVDRLLNSPQFGVHWGRHWMDVIRYCETLGHEFDYPIRGAWQYRDVVIDGFNADVPYADRVREHLAGDLIAKPRIHPLTGINQSLASTGWWWMGDTVHAPVDVKTDWSTRVDNQIDVASKAFLGMTVACARCHDHKFDAISLKDYYGLVGVMQSSRRLYCPTDPRGDIAIHQSKLVEHRAEADAVARDIYQQSSNQAEVERWLSELCKAAKNQPDKLDALLSQSSALYALLPAMVTDFATAKTQTSERVDQMQTAFDSWRNASDLFVDFTKGFPNGWSVHTAVQSRPGQEFCLTEDNASKSLDWFSGKWPMPNRTGIFASDRFGRKADVTLRSPNFEVKRPCICIKLRGKGIHSVALVSNYFMHEFTGLLFSDLRKEIDQPGDQGWIAHRGDLEKYFGHPAFLSLEDTDQGWFELAEVRFADNPPPIQPADSAVELARADAAPDKLIQMHAERITAAMLAVAEQRNTIGKADNAMLREALLLSEKLNVQPPFVKPEALTEQSTQLATWNAAAPAATTLITITEGDPSDAAIAIRGNPHQLGEQVQRGFFQELIRGLDVAPGSSGRREIAESIVSPKHPLTARVMVNRVWHYLLGSGLVNSTDNLGVLGGRPTHPELLDYLSRQFVEHDWSVKWLVREIVTSQTYRTSSEMTDNQRERDADGRLWSHREVKRLTSESLRDAMLAVANSLDVRIGDVSTAIHLNDKMTGRGRPGKSGPLDGDNRRSVFIEVRRNFLDPFLLAFDFPMPATSVGKRNVSNVPAQALGLLNDPLVAEMAERWAKGLEKLHDDSDRIQTMFRTAYARFASESELAQCMELIQQAGNDSGQREQAWRDLAHVLLNAKEFSYVR